MFAGCESPPASQIAAKDVERRRIKVIEKTQLPFSFPKLLESLSNGATPFASSILNRRSNYYSQHQLPLVDDRVLM